MSQPSSEELEKIFYLQKLDSLKEKKYVENLTYILESGFTNFEVNLNLLKRNNNDLGIVINNLCNGSNITDSMFIWGWSPFALFFYVIFNGDKL